LTLSVLESLTRLPVSEREAILASLSESEAEQLQHDWSFYARPNQLLPPLVAGLSTFHDAEWLTLCEGLGSPHKAAAYKH
jgi:hypothetical protein